MKKEQHTSPAVGLSDEAIIEGLRNRDPQITRDYFYGVCRIAYHIYQQRRNKLYINKIKSLKNVPNL